MRLDAFRISKTYLEMPSLRLILVTTLVVVILAYLGVLVSGGGLRSRIDGFTSLSPKTNTFTLYYMNGCPHCESILPEYKQFAAAGQFVGNGITTDVRLLEQGDPNAAPELEAHNVKGFPTFVLSTAGGENLEYKGDRTISAIKDYITKNAS